MRLTQPLAAACSDHIIHRKNAALRYRFEPLRRSRSAGTDPLDWIARHAPRSDPLPRRNWTITRGQLFAAHGSRYVWQGARAAARGLIYYRRKKARTMAGSMVAATG